MKTVPVFDQNQNQIGYVKSFRGAKFTGYATAYSAISSNGETVGICKNSFESAKKLLESKL